MDCPKCQISIADHPANACLDALFGRKVMKYEVGDCLDRGCYCRVVKQRLVSDWFPFNPSTNITHAMQGVEKVKKELDGFKLEYYPTLNSWVVWYGTPWIGYKSTQCHIPAELAITRALIL